MFERIRVLCVENGLTVTELCKEITGSTGNLPTWKKGNIKAEALCKIADYFNISVDYLLGRTEERTANTNIIKTGDINSSSNIGNNNSISISATAEAQNEINSILSGLTPRERTELMMMIYQFADQHTA